MKKAYVVIGILVACGLAGGWVLMNTSAQSETSYRMARVKRSTIVVAVSGSGQISAENTIDIKPEASGKIVSVRVRQGDIVKKNQVIARIDSRNATLALNTARAGFENAEANYKKLIAGLTTPELEVAKAALTSAELSLSNAKITAKTTIANATIALETAKRAFSNTNDQQALSIKNALSTFLNADLEASPATTETLVSATVGGAYTGSEHGSYTITIKPSTNGFNYDVSGLEDYTGSVTRGFPLPLGTRGLTLTISTSGTLKEDMRWVVSVPNVRATGYLSSSNTYETALQNKSQILANAQGSLDASVVTHSQTIASANASIANAENALVSARASYDLKVAAARPEDVASSRASVAQAQAQVDTARNNLANTAITAPIDGVLAVFSLNAGDQASPSVSVGTLITTQQTAKITLNEVDVLRIHVGDRATLTFDALSNFSLTGHVAAIDTLGTVSQGVVNYIVQLALDSQDARIKPGMSVTASIITATKTDVLTLPSSAVKLRADTPSVESFDPPFAPDANGLVKTQAKPANKEVEIGISNDTQTEVIAGLSEGDMVVVQTILPDAKRTANGNSAFGLPQVRVGGGGGGGFRQGGAR